MNCPGNYPNALTNPNIQKRTKYREYSAELCTLPQCSSAIAEKEKLEFSQREIGKLQIK